MYNYLYYRLLPSTITEHLKQEHGLTHSNETIAFLSMDEFRVWKQQLEEQTRSFYVQKSGTKKCGDQTHLYLYCNRSGTYIAKGKGKRSLKTQGTSKIGVCMSYIKVCENLDTKSVSVEYCSTHTHKHELAHLPLSDDVGKVIAGKLQLGVTIERIMDDIRDAVNEKDRLGRDHMVNRQDILNIQNKLNFDCIHKHGDDQSSVCAWVEELKKMKYNPVIFFKPQGIDGDEGEIHKDDFMLVFQTEFQRDLLIFYSNDVVCMDATHGTNMYDFQLITLLVVDTYGEGIPVAWAISNHENTAHITKFLEVIKDRVDLGHLCPKVFMSDDADQYYNSWKAVFPWDGTKKLLCAWHVDRAWRKSLNKLVSDTQIRGELYHHLRILLLEQDESGFRVKLQQVVSYFLQIEPQFCDYFRREYISRVEQWATFGRVSAGVNTNMMLESFHRKLKVCYLGNKQNRRIDSLLYVIMRISRNLIFECFIKDEKGKITHRISEINKRHKSAVQLFSDGVRVIKSGSEWKIVSQSARGETYLIREMVTDCMCKQRCIKCNLCVHMYSCSCMDSAIHATICKHVHLMRLQLSDSESTHHNPEHHDDPKTCSAILPLENYTAGVGTDSAVREKAINEKLLLLTSMVDSCSNSDALGAVSKHLDSAIGVLQARITYATTSKLDVCKRPAPNENNKIQARFFSTKKKCVRQSSSLSKPTEEEIEIAEETLNSVDVVVCGICYKEDDHGVDEVVKWVRCLQCLVWFHRVCIGIESHDLPCNTCALHAVEK